MRRFVMVLPAFIPAAFSLLLMSVWLGGNLYDYLPTTTSTYNDAVFYWMEGKTFRAVGMSGGYFTLNEKPAAASYTHFYAHGPGFALVYGLLGKLVPSTDAASWYAQTIVAFNLVGITLGLLLFLHFARLERKELLWPTAYLITAWTILFYLSSSMQEGMQITIACILAGLAIPIIREGVNAPRWTKIMFALCVGAAALTRPSWAFLLLPYALLIQPSMSWRRVGYALVLSGLGIGGLTALYFYQAAPWPLEYLEATLEKNPILRFVKSRLEMVIRSLAAIFQGDELMLLVRSETAGLAALTGFIVVAEGQIMRRLRGLSPRFMRHRVISLREALFHALNLGMIFVVVMSFYIFGPDGQDFRLFAPHLTLSILLLMAFRRWKFIVIILALNIMVLPAFLETYQAAWRTQFALDRSYVRNFRDVVADVIPYHPDASNAWCNTVLISIDVPTSGFPPEIMTFPAGIGVSFFIHPEEVAQPLKSGYVVLKE